MADEVRAIGYRRFVELEKVAAREGPGTEPHIILELQDLRTKYGFTLTGGEPWRGVRDVSPEQKKRFEDDLLMNTVAGLFQRQSELEQSVQSFIAQTQEYRKRDDAERIERQRIQDRWFTVLGVAVAAVLIIVVYLLYATRAVI